MAATAERRAVFRGLHREGCFLMPNPFDVGSVRLLTAMGFPALATTSSGFAATQGRRDGAVARDGVIEHVRAMAAATDLPVSVDAEHGYADTAAGVAETVALLADAGAAGCSIEDWNQVTERIEPIDVACERVAAAAGSARAVGMVLTARCENHLRGVDDLADTITRLVAYRDAGAEVLYAPALVDPGQIRELVESVGAPVNVLLQPHGPPVAELAALGVRRISIGGALAWIAYGAAVAAAQSLMDGGAIDPDLGRLDRSVANAAFE